VVVGYNDDPPEGEWGSAIFLHIARADYSPTQGCVAFARDDLLELVTLIGPQTRLNVLSIHADEIAPPSNAPREPRTAMAFDAWIEVFRLRKRPPP